MNLPPMPVFQDFIGFDNAVERGMYLKALVAWTTVCQKIVEAHYKAPPMPPCEHDDEEWCCDGCEPS